jgi:hypothetical protein
MPVETTFELLLDLPKKCFADEVAQLQNIFACVASWGSHPEEGARAALPRPLRIRPSSHRDRAGVLL